MTTLHFAEFRESKVPRFAQLKRRAVGSGGAHL